MKVELFLAKNTAPALARLYERLTGKKLSPEGLAKLKATVAAERRAG